MLVHQFNATNIKFINPVPVPIWAELGPAQPQLVFSALIGVLELTFCVSFDAINTIIRSHFLHLI